MNQHALFAAAMIVGLLIGAVICGLLVTVLIFLARCFPGFRLGDTHGLLLSLFVVSFSMVAGQILAIRWFNALDRPEQ